MADLRDYKGKYRRRRRKRKAKRLAAVESPPPPKPATKPAPKPKAEPLGSMVERARIDGLDRAEIKAELEAAGVEFNGRTSTEKLRAILLTTGGDHGDGG